MAKSLDGIKKLSPEDKKRSRRIVLNFIGEKDKDQETIAPVAPPPVSLVSKKVDGVLTKKAKVAAKAEVDDWQVANELAERERIEQARKKQEEVEKKKLEKIKDQEEKDKAKATVLLKKQEEKQKLKMALERQKEERLRILEEEKQFKLKKQGEERKKKFEEQEKIKAEIELRRKQEQAKIEAEKVAKQQAKNLKKLEKEKRKQEKISKKQERKRLKLEAKLKRKEEKLRLKMERKRLNEEADKKRLEEKERIKQEKIAKSKEEERQKLEAEKKIKEEQEKRKQEEIAKFEALKKEKAERQAKKILEQEEKKREALRIAREKAEAEAEARQQRQAEIERQKIEWLKQKQEKKRLIEQEKKIKAELKIKNKLKRRKQWLKFKKRFLENSALVWGNFKKSLIAGLKLSWRLILIIIALLVSVYVLLFLLVVKFGLDNNFFRSVSNYITLPALVSQIGAINYYEYADKIEVAKSPENLIGGDARSVVKQKLVEDLILKNLASKYDLEITAEDIKFGYLEAFKNVSNKAQDDLSQVSWPYVLRQALARLYLQDEEINQVALARIKKINELIGAGKSLDEVKKYSDESSGDYIKIDEAQAKFSIAINNLKIGQTSSIILGSDGYYIIEKYGQKSSSIGIKYIFVKAKTLNEYLAEKINEIRVISFVD